MAEAIPVVVTQRAIEEMASVAQYISGQGFPENAKRYYDRMLAFTETLGHMSLKFPICRKPAFNRWNYRCGVFESTYVFVCKIHDGVVLLLSILHTKQMS